MPTVKIDWGIEGLKYALRDNDIVIIVDVMRFSSAAVTAAAEGFTIYPVPNNDKGRELAEGIGAELAGKAPEARFSLSPLSYIENRQHSNKKVVLASPNGATCAAQIKEYDTGYIGCFLNAEAVARRAEREASASGRDFAPEDYLGAGAIISFMSLPKSTDAVLCESAFNAVRDNLRGLLLESYSGRWLLQNDAQKDLEHLLRINYYDIVPEINNGKIVIIKNE